jgi:peroxiredoxin
MSNGLQIGDMLPDFELPDDNGVKHKLSDLQGDNALVVMFGRGEHCPRERQHQIEMLKVQQWAPVAFTELVTILPNDLHDLSKMKIATGAWWTYLSDGDYQAQEQLGIHEYTDPHHQATVPHTVICEPGSLRIAKVYVGYWFWGRPSSYQLWLDLQDVFQRTKADFDPTTPEARAAWDTAK